MLLRRFLSFLPRSRLVGTRPHLVRSSLVGSTSYPITISNSHRTFSDISVTLTATTPRKPYFHFVILNYTATQSSKMVQAVTRAIRATGCTNCRTQLLRSITAIAGVQWPTQTPQRRLAARQTAVRHSSTMPPNFRTLVSEEDQAAAIEAAAREAEQIAKEDSIDESLDEATLVADYAKLYDDAHIDESAPRSASDTDSTPWYLQVDAPEISSANTAALARQELPPLPENSPPILEALVEHVGVNLGLDSLTMLDLRHLDPPAALGSNLIMLIGTARSEKHLHVSADRLCRWLRTNYKLRPDADGLLGRNELKLRLKRKAKKQRLVGPRHADDADDGVRTGWVCVNVGEVPTAPSESKIVEEVQQNYIGFGRRSEGVKIVVQMLVEEKREELELERLWGGIAKRQSKGVLLELDDEGNWQGQGPKGDVLNVSEPRNAEGLTEEEFGKRFGETQDGEFPEDTEWKPTPHAPQEGNLFRKIST